MRKTIARTSLKDIAEAVGVSTITASRALDPQRTHLICETTRGRVRAMAEKLNYTSNLAARRFKRGRSETISVAIPQSVFKKPQHLDFSAHGSALFWQIMQGILVTAKQMKYDIKLEPFFEPDNPDAFLRNISAPYSDGVIFLGIEDFMRVIEKSVANEVPCVLITTEPSACKNVPEISFDLSGAIHNAVDALVLTGKKDVAMIYPYESMAGSRRMVVFRDALMQAGIYNPRLAFPIPTWRSLRAFVREHCRKPRFEAVFCHNDTMATLLLNELELAAVAAPRQITVIGYDNNPVYEDDAFSTISLDRYGLGVEAVRTLVNIVEGREVFIGKKLIPTTFVNRGI